MSLLTNILYIPTLTVTLSLLSAATETYLTILSAPSSLKTAVRGDGTFESWEEPNTSRFERAEAAVPSAVEY